MTFRYREKSSGNWIMPETQKYNTTKNGAYYEGYDVNIYRIFAPTISSPTILACCSNNVTLEASSYGAANTFYWIVSGATIISGQGSATLTIAPDPLQAIVTVDCVASRNTGSIMYQKSKSQTLSKTNRTISITSSNTAYICAGMSKIFQIDNDCGMTGSNWSAPNCTVSAETIVNGKRQITVTPSSSLTTGSLITVSATASYSGGCTASNSLPIFVGTPRTTLPGATCYTTNAPCSVTAIANYNYLNFTLSSPLGNYIPLYGDWQWEKISGNFYFLDNVTGQYNATTRYSPQADLYLTGANPTDNPLKFRTRVKSECGWGDWTEYIWNDGTTTPPPPPPPPTEYFKIAPNPATSYFDVTLIDPNIAPQTASPKAIKIYSQYGQLLQNNIVFYGVGYTDYNINSLASGIYYVSITFDDFYESHTLIKQ